MPCKKKKYDSRFSAARIKKIMQSDDEVGKVAAVVPIIMSRVLEVFVENLLKDSCKITKQRNARTLTPAHIKASILQNSQLDFLKETVSLIPDIQGSNDDEQIDYQLNNQQLNYYANFHPINSSTATNSNNHKFIKQFSHPATSSNEQLNNDLSTINQLTDQLPQQFIIQQQQPQLITQATSSSSSFSLNSNNGNNKRFKNTYSRSNSAPVASLNEFNENQKKTKLKRNQEEDLEEDDLEEEEESLSDDDEEVFSTSTTITEIKTNEKIKDDKNQLPSTSNKLENSLKVYTKKLEEDDDYDT